MSSSPFDLLPTEVIQKIFLSCNFSTIICLKVSKTETIQLVISQVCSRWRSIAVSTIQLWDNIGLYWSSEHADLTVQLASVWFHRAGKSPITLSVYCILDALLDSPHIHQFCRLISFHRFKYLGGNFKNFWHLLHDKSYEEALDCLQELSLGYPTPPIKQKQSLATSGCDSYCQLPSLRHLNLNFRCILVSRHRDLYMIPWHQLTTLVIRNSANFPTLRIICECQALVKFKLLQFRANADLQVVSPAISLPHLRSLEIDSRFPTLHLIKILLTFIMPSLTSIYLSLKNEAHIYQLPEPDWHSKHLDAPFNQIQDFTFTDPSNILNVSIFLRRMPYLRKLVLDGAVSLDDDTAEQIWTGRLGHHIDTIALRPFGDSHSIIPMDRVLDMIEKRQENAKSDERRNLQPLIDVSLACTSTPSNKTKERVEYLERLHNVRIKLETNI